MGKNNWTSEQEQYLVDNFDSMKIQEIADNLGKSYRTITLKTKDLGLSKLKHKPWTDEDINTLEEGYPILDKTILEKSLNRNWSAIIRKAVELGISRDAHNRMWTEEEIAYLTEFYGVETEEVLCENLRGRSFVAVQQFARKLNLERNHRHIKKGYYFNDEFFDYWSKEMAWVLGWITSDGHFNPEVNRLKFDLHSRDEDVLHKIGSLLLNGYRISKAERRDSVILSMNNANFTDDLLNLGVTNNKSFTIRPPAIPIEFISHYIRGVLEGDGSVTIGTPQNSVTLGISFLGNIHVVSFIAGSINKELNVEGRVKNLEYKNGELANLRFFGLNAVQVLEWLYEDTTDEIRMNRKYNNYIEFMKSHGNKRFGMELY